VYIMNCLFAATYPAASASVGAAAFARLDIF
jgi:hypothetical protein